MKFLIVCFALALATVSAFDLRGNEIKSRSVVMPAVEAEGRITNGQNAAMGQFPYQVGLSLLLENRKTSWCGGSLIGNEWVLTAAHCTEGVKSVTVSLGATLRTRAQVKYTVSANNIIIHPGWNRKTAKNDISLIKIPATAYSTLIQAVQLPSIASSYASYVGESVIASGWGATSDTDKGVAADLQWARMEVIGGAACTKTYGFSFTSSNVCVSTPAAVSTCSGDSGGPLVLASTNIQIGLTSYGPTVGCEKELPVVFTRVSSYLDWIKENTGIYY